MSLDQDREQGFAGEARLVLAHPMLAVRTGWGGSSARVRRAAGRAGGNIGPPLPPAKSGAVFSVGTMFAGSYGGP